MVEPWWRDLLLVVLGAILGAVFALAGQFFLEKWRVARHRKALRMVLREELRAVRFDAPNQTFGAFTSQTFDQLFADVALLLPLVTAQTVIRYHFRMKHLEGRIREWDPLTLPTIDHVKEMEGIRRLAGQGTLVKLAEELEG